MNGTGSWAPHGPLDAYEHDRLESLRSYGLLDTPPDPVFDDLARMAATLCDAPIAAVALLDADRLWLKARYGTTVQEGPRAGSFCSTVVGRREPLVVEDTAADSRWARTVEAGIRSHAGVPLIGRDGLPLGALVVADTVPRPFPAEMLDWLRRVARQVIAQMELQRADHRAGLTPGFETSDVLDPQRVRAAIDASEFVPWLQPVIDVRTGAMCGAEALVRWIHPDRGVISPAQFVPMLEATGLMLPVGRQVLRGSLRALRALYDGGAVRPPFGVSVNVSAMQAVQPGFARTVFEALEDTGVAPDLLTLELTETGGPTPVAAIRRELEELRDGGVKLDADDFGTGHSTLQRILELPLTGVKLDLSIIQQITVDPRITRLVRWMIYAGHDLGLEIVAEGVETTGQWDLLRAIGCDRAQGYLFGRPVAQAEFPASPAAVAG
ncbi:EAL domain-containing protein [Nocardioides sp. SYSU DS0651]|uniref:sensor domain-containing phosphodiesterase n=1 Tax=Nocardioides sp. SYSU DS0651 TaxID=3415955 RepID=UPI003F4C92DA